MRRKLRIGIVFGGKSGEHEVSMKSAASVMQHLDRSKYDVIPLAITKKGKWLSGASSRKLLSLNKKKALRSASQSHGLAISASTDTLKKTAFDVIFPVLHGTYGEDGSIQGLLEMANIPYVGSGVLGSALGMDKVVQKELFAYHMIRQAPFIWFYADDFHKNQKKYIVQVTSRLFFPIFVKPSGLGSSVGITKVHNKHELVRAIKTAALYDPKILIEQGIENIREIECSVLGNNQPKASVPGEVIPSREFYDYKAKYIDQSSRLIIPAQLPRVIAKKIQYLSMRAFKIVNLSGMARVDFFVKKNTHAVYINEVNTIPGFTSISMYPKLWETSGLSYTKLLDSLIRLALQRHKAKNRLWTSYNLPLSKKK